MPRRQIIRIDLRSLARLFAAGLLCLCLSAGARLSADDAVYRRGSTTPLHGDITSVTRTEVVLTGRTNKKEYRIPANEVERIRWEAESPQVSQIRIEERNGQYDKAITGYDAALKLATNENLRADLEYHIARATAAKALKDEDQYDSAIGLLEKFRTSHSASFRYYDAMRSWLSCT